jgi:hypothetical protein
MLVDRCYFSNGYNFVVDCAEEGFVLSRRVGGKLVEADSKRALLVMFTNEARIGKTNMTK